MTNREILAWGFKNDLAAPLLGMTLLLVGAWVACWLYFGGVH